MDKLDNAKIFLIRKSIQMDSRITKEKILPGIKDGLIKDIGIYVRKHNQMPTMDDAMERYKGNAYFVDTIGMIGITIGEMEDMTKELLGQKIKGKKPNDQETMKKFTARSAPCPCGSGKKFKRCCGE